MSAPTEDVQPRRDQVGDPALFAVSNDADNFLTPLITDDTTGGLVTYIAGSVPLDTNLTEVGGSDIALGQTTMSASLPVAIASDQSSIPVTLPDLEAGLAAGTAPSKGTVILGQYNSSPLTLTNGQTAAVAVNSSAQLEIGSITANQQIQETDPSGNPIDVGFGSGSLPLFVTPLLNGTNATLLTSVDQQSTNGDHTVISATASKRIKVYAYQFCMGGFTGTQLIKMLDGTGGNLLLQLFLASSGSNNAQCVSASVPYPSFLFATTAGNLLDMNLTTNGNLVYYNLSYWVDDNI